MSEYIEIHSEPTDDPFVMIVRTNLTLAIDETEHYDSVEAMEKGSVVAQALALVEGIIRVQIATRTLTVEIDHETPWHVVESDIAAALKDFFL